MKKKWKRFLILFFGLLCFSAFVFLVLGSLGESISFFYSPTEIINNNPGQKNVRLGGIVKDIEVNVGCLKFIVADDQSQVEVIYDGLSPALIRNGIDVVVSGNLKGNVFQAKQVFIKHDERYYPESTSS